MSANIKQTKLSYFH